MTQSGKKPVQKKTSPYVNEGGEYAKPEDFVPDHTEITDRYGEPMLTVHKSALAAYMELVKGWGECKRCPLHGSRKSVVFARGSLPADVLFIGEAPGPVEDDLGFPFIGPSGRLLNTLLGELNEVKQGWSYAITNPVGCVPWADEDAQRFRQPMQDEIQACNPRFVTIIRLAKPAGIVLLGRVAENFWGTYGPGILGQLNGANPLICSIQHPSYWLRNGGVNSIPYKNASSSLKQFLFQKLKVGG